MLVYSITVWLYILWSTSSDAELPENVCRWLQTTNLLLQCHRTWEFGHSLRHRFFAERPLAEMGAIRTITHRNIQYLESLKLKGSGSLLSIFIEIVDRLHTSCEFMLICDIPSWCSWFNWKPLLVTTDSLLANLAQDCQSWKMNNKCACFRESQVLGQILIHDPCPCSISHATRHFV